METQHSIVPDDKTRVRPRGAPREAAAGRKNEVARFALRVPEYRRRGFVNAALGTASPRQAIKAKCFECVGYEDIAERVGTCTTGRCPLWAYRPYQDKNQPDEQE